MENKITKNALGNKTYDLTNYKDYAGSLALFAINPPLGALALIYKFFNKLVSSKQQFKGAEKIIEAGKENGTKKIKLKVSRDVGINLKAKYENTPIKLNLGTGEVTDLEVEYK